MTGFLARAALSPNAVTKRFPLTVPVPVKGGTWRLGELGNLSEPVDLLVERIEYGPELHLGNLGEHPDVFDVLEGRILAAGALDGCGRAGTALLAAVLACSMTSRC